MKIEIRPRWSEISKWLEEAWVIGALLALPGALYLNLKHLATGAAVYVAICVVGGSIRRVD